MATTKSSTATDAPTDTGGDSGAAEVQAKVDEAAEKGYFGHSPDDTPRENYTLQTPPDAPTPETVGRVEEAKARADAGK